MKRRKFLQLSGMGALGVSLTSFSQKKIVETTNSTEIIVVGAGTFGVWTAYHLNQMGAKVTLLDAYGPGNSRASSGGETRLIQADNDNDTYIESALRSYQLWKNIEEISGEQIVLSTGRLAMSSNIAHEHQALKRQKQLERQGINNTEVLSQDEIRYRWPQINSEGIATAMYNGGGASGSTFLARKGIQTVAKEFEKNGGKLKIAKGIPVIKNGRVQGIDIGNEVLKSQHYVFACGSWLSKVFPGLLLPKLKVERRDVLFVGTPAGNSQFTYPNIPEWSVYGSGFYGFPNIKERGFKVAIYPDHNTFDPDTDERLINHYQVKRTHDFVKHRFPALKDQPIVESRVCQVTYSTDGNFIIDKLPASENTWIVGAGSGHGFKHGPAMGEHAAKRILRKQINTKYTNLFKLKEKNF
ncbi:Glycine/D-amino acid oxidase [Tenacibaculum sp. MAR_2009_124]|uniref:NAD(P)/FAD-dependent oxidoreductase n=1 Tax=Tenacibaculum sp. MAR_2009_124 TaxID=1250059 RepID=UPI000896C563|nr:FAD-dependent oxidoreductase [Tenacibaculum sp. MAR_2009_124]SEC51661.1 Glycine/D-amino acid oxidase [Tenacibaculum sp. MAR_2009_124]